MARQWEGRTRGGAFGYLFFIRLVKIFGLGAAYAFLCLVVLYFIPFAPKRTKSVWVYSRKILGLSIVRSSLAVVSSYYAFGQSIIDKVVTGMGLSDRFTYSFDRHDLILEPVGKKLGCVVIGAHVGSWQMGAPFFGPNGAKVNVVMYDNEYQQVKDVISENTGHQQYSIIPVKEDDVSFLISITAALRRGELVCIQGDRYMHEDRVMTATFMGREAEFPEGPFVLASKMKCPVVFYFAMRGKGRHYRFVFRTPESVLPYIDGQDRKDYIFKAYVKALEDIVREYPMQWFNYYDFWKLYSDK